MPELTNKLSTRRQKMAEHAFSAVQNRGASGEYASFARAFPALIHDAGLCQAVAFAQAKGKGSGPQSLVLEDVALTMQLDLTADQLANKARICNVTEYLRLTRLAMEAAGWIKRYVEASA